MDVFRVGAKAGMVKSHGGRSQLREVAYYDHYPERTIWYANPNEGVHWKYFGIDLGTLITNRDQSASDDAIGWLGGTLPSGNIRIGNLNSWYFTLGVFDNQPLVTGGGWFDLGLGFNLGRPHSSLWVGFGAGPFDGGVLSLKGDIPIRQRFLLNLRGQLRAGDVTEYGLSVGGRTIF